MNVILPDNELFPFNNPKVSELIENVHYNIEPIRTGKKDKNGKSEHIFNEILSNFGSVTTTPEALDVLRKENKTFNLFQKMFSFAIQQMEANGTPSSVNLYLMDLSNPKLIDETIQKEKEYGFDCSKICLEILEYNYGELNSDAINNLLILKERGYKFAIDDFSLEYDPEDLSFDNLATLLSNNIIPDYVKIDGKYLGKIFSGQYEENHIKELRLIIKFLKLKNIKIIGEWIGNAEEGYNARSLGIELYQGKFLKDDFELKDDDEQDKVKSFKLVRDVQSFKLYKTSEKVHEETSDKVTEEIYEQIAISPRVLAVICQNNYDIDHILTF